MRVKLPTLDMSDDTLKSIRRSDGQNGKAMREEAVEWATRTLTEAQARLVEEFPPDQRASRPVVRGSEWTLLAALPEPGE